MEEIYLNLTLYQGLTPLEEFSLLLVFAHKVLLGHNHVHLFILSTIVYAL